MQGVEWPVGRSGHGMTLVKHGKVPALLIHGGRSKDDHLLQDTWQLEL